MVGERIRVDDLAVHLRSAGFDTNTFVFIVSSAPPRQERWPAQTVVVQKPKDWSHAQIRHLMDELETKGIGRWPDSFTGKMETAQPESGPY